MRRKIYHGLPLAWTHDGSGIHSLYLAGGDSGKTRSSLKQKKQECGKGAGLSAEQSSGKHSERDINLTRNQEHDDIFHKILVGIKVYEPNDN